MWDGLSHDQQEAWAIFGPYTNFDWTAGFNRAVVVWAQGKLWRVDVASGQRDATSPSAPSVEQTVDRRRCASSASLDEGTFAPKMIRDVATSADGQHAWCSMRSASCGASSCPMARRSG